MSASERIGLELVATVGRRHTDTPVERLPDAAALRNWFGAHELNVIDCTAADLAPTHALREAIYDLVESAALHRPPHPDALDLVGTTGHSVSTRKLLWDKHTGFHLTDSALGVPEALATIARDTVDLLTGPDRNRLHQCEAEPCGTVFLTAASGRARRWCSSSTCGNRERVRAFRATRQS